MALRCEVTGNTCGTDTWKVGCPCICENCRRYISEDFDEEDFFDEDEDRLDESWFHDPDMGDR